MADVNFAPFAYSGEELYFTIRDDYELHHPVKEPVVTLNGSWSKVESKAALRNERNALVRQEFAKWWDSLSDEDKIINAYRVLQKINKGGTVPPIPAEVAKALIEFRHCG